MDLLITLIFGVRVRSNGLDREGERSEAGCKGEGEGEAENETRMKIVPNDLMMDEKSDGIFLQIFSFAFFVEERSEGGKTINFSPSVIP
ncbi:MAG: hypothetical protein ACI33O_03230 [Bhargavaea sp.]